MAETSASTETSATTTNRSPSSRKAAATNRSTAAKKAAATRARTRANEAGKRSTAANQAAETRREVQRTPVDRYVDLAGRAVTIQVGAALVARDRVQTELRTFEERGSTARTRFERELGKRRERVERDLRALQTARRDAAAQAGLAGARAQNIVQSGITAGTQVAAKAVERVARVA